MTRSVKLTIRMGEILTWRRHRCTEGATRSLIEDYLGETVPRRPYRVTYRLNPRGRRRVGRQRSLFCFWPKDWTEKTRYSRTVEVI